MFCKLMPEYIYIVVAFVLSALSAGFMLSWILNLCYKKHIFDIPTERKIHSNNIPRLGGAVLVPSAIFGGCLSLALLMEVNLSDYAVKLSMQLIGAGMLLIYFMGLLDDVVGLQARVKFGVQLMVALAFPICDLYINNLGGFLGIWEIPNMLGYALTVFLIIMMMNAINLIDGIDGLASSLSMIALLGFCFMFSAWHLPVFSISCAAVMGALLPFMYFNLFGTTEQHTKTFLGDSGSLFLGTALAYLMLKSSMQNEVVIRGNQDGLAYSFMLLFLPCADLVRVALARLRRGKSIMQADKTHLHHKLLGKGWGQTTVLIMILALQVLLMIVDMVLIYFDLGMTVIFFTNVIIFTLLNVWLPVPNNEVVKQTYNDSKPTIGNERRKILHISKFYPPYSGGLEDVCKNVAESVTEYEQMVFCFNDGPDDVDEMINGVRVYRVGMWREVCRQPISFHMGVMLSRVLHNYKPDIVHLHCPNPLATLLLLMKLDKKTKLVVHWHSDIVVQKFLHMLFSPIEDYLLKRANVLIATSPNYVLGSELLRRHESKCRVVPNTVIVEKIDAHISQNRVDELRKQYGKFIFFVGRHVTYKGIEFLIDAARQLGPNVPVLIGGKGPLTKELHNRAAGLTNVHFLGRVPDEDLGNYFKACTVLAFPSITKNEAFGVVLAEAMYCGAVPVTFTIDCSGVNWVNIGNETGIEVPNRDLQEYTKALTTLLENDELRTTYSCAAQKRVKSMFLPDIATATLYDIYNNL